jgi:hypothetical protein
MDQAAHNKIVSFIWGIADDVLPALVAGRRVAQQAAASL